MPNSPNITNVGSTLDKMKALAKANHHNYLTLEHMLLALLSEKDIVDMINETDGDIKGLSGDLDKWMVNGEIPKTAGNNDPKLTQFTNHAIQTALTLVVTTGKEQVLPVDLLIGLLHFPDTTASHFLEKNGIKVADLMNIARHYRGLGEDQLAAGEGVDPQANGGQGPMPAFNAAPQPNNIAVENPAQPNGGNNQTGDAEQRRSKKVLERFTVNLNQEATDGRLDPLIGREDIVDRLITVTAQRRKNNMIVLGDPGVGKSAVIEGLASKIVKGDVPEMFKDATIYSLDVTELLAGAKFRGDVEERIKSVLKALKTVQKPILFIDEVHMIVGAGNGGVGAMDLSNILKPALARGELRCIGTTTAEEYRKHFERDRALTRRFQTYDLEQPTPEETVKILMGLKSKFEEFHGLTYTDDAIKAAVDLSVRHIHNRYLPDKAIDLIDAAGAVVKTHSETKVVGLEQIEKEVARISKLPLDTVKLQETNRLDLLETDMKNVVFGQDGAIEKIVNQVILAKAGLREADKTRGSYLLVGPSGVGKTEMARQLAKTLGIPLVRFDMSEFQEKHTVSRFIGSPPGYVGYSDGGAGSGALVNALEKTPECVLLLDEVEKAHPDVLNVLLQVMDNGTITASNNKSVSARNAYLLMTSNLGAADSGKKKIGFGGGYHYGAIDDAVRTGLPPEFRNRLDSIIKFERLNKEVSLKVIDKFIKELMVMLEPKNVKLEMNDDVKEWLLEKGFTPELGGRPLARCIQENMKVPLSREMVFGNLKNGGKCRFVVVPENEEKKLSLEVEVTVEA